MAIASSLPPLKLPILNTLSVSHFSLLGPELHSSDALQAASDIAMSCDRAVHFIPSSMNSQKFLREFVSASNGSKHACVYAVDLSVIATKLNQFREALPQVTPHYAMKCNPDPVVISFLARLGVSFDCASRPEIDLVKSAIKDTAPLDNVSNRIVFANPCKTPSALGYARSLGIELMTFDCVGELEKISVCYPEALLLLRIAVKDSTALCPLSSKYGAKAGEITTLLEAAKRLGLNLVGVAFHVGSGCTNVNAYVEAIRMSKWIFKFARHYGMYLNVLDIGGGFPGHDDEAPITFMQIADAIRPLIEPMVAGGVRVIAEPGRYFVTSAYTLATEVVLARNPRDVPCYFLSDGVLGSFRDAMLLNVKYPAKVLLRKEAMGHDDQQKPCNLYGPTREVFDVVGREVSLPTLSRGDWLFFENMGAYTISLSSTRRDTDKYLFKYLFGVE